LRFGKARRGNRQRVTARACGVCDGSQRTGGRFIARSLV
jgi:hypothetical protein